jgi:hypothetical protein
MPTAQPTEQPYQADLKAEDSGLRFSREEISRVLFKKDQPVNVQVNDQLVDKESHGGFLEFPTS